MNLRYATKGYYLDSAKLTIDALDAGPEGEIVRGMRCLDTGLDIVGEVVEEV